MNLNDVLRRFPDARLSGSGWSARCPAYDDHNPSHDGVRESLRSSVVSQFNAQVICRFRYGADNAN